MGISQSQSGVRLAGGGGLMSGLWSSQPPLGELEKLRNESDNAALSSVSLRKSKTERKGGRHGDSSSRLVPWVEVEVGVVIVASFYLVQYAEQSLKR